MRVSTRLYLPTTTTEYVCVCVYVCMASRIYSVCIYSVRVYLLCMRVSTPSTQNPDERARSDRARSGTRPRNSWPRRGGVMKLCTKR